MIGRLPTSINVNGIDYDIRTDYRDILVIIQAYSDHDLTDEEKACVMLEIIYKDYVSIPESDIKEACEKAVDFLNCNGKVGNPESDVPLYSFEKDEQMLFSAINKVAGKEIREVEYMHYWTFLGFFNEIGEGMFSTILSIRNKKRKKKKLEKWEQEFYQKNKELIDLPLTKEEEEQKELLKDFFG